MNTDRALIASQKRILSGLNWTYRPDGRGFETGYGMKVGLTGRENSVINFDRTGSAGCDTLVTLKWIAPRARISQPSAGVSNRRME